MRYFVEERNNEQLLRRGAGRYDAPRHHSHRKSHSKSKLSKFWKKYQQLIKNVALLVLALSLVASLAVLADLYSKGDVTEKPTATEHTESPVMRIEIPYFEGEVLLVTDLAQEYIRRDMTEPAMEVMDRLNERHERHDYGLPVVLTLDVSGVPGDCLVAAATVEVSEHSDFSDPALFTMKVGDYSVEIPHLKTNTQYYYRITYSMTDGSVNSVSSAFKTADTPRILDIEGAVNVRDIGGWKTVDGKTVRQGLLYRGSELDGAVEPTYCLSDAGRHDMLAVLGIRTDMDLRADTDNVYGTDALGANVEHIYYPTGAYSDIFSDYCKDMTARIFSDLADESKYPAYIHCTYGMDRTGTVCYLLEALLGLSEEDLQREYELSALYNGYAGTEHLVEFVAELKKLEGDTLQQKVENFLLDAGVTIDEITKIREIFLED